MKKILLFLILLLFIVTIKALNKDTCEHLSGLEYDTCYLMQVKGR